MVCIVLWSWQNVSDQAMEKALQVALLYFFKIPGVSVVLGNSMEISGRLPFPFLKNVVAMRAYKVAG
jgi:hypothetical protein